MFLNLHYWLKDEIMHGLPLTWHNTSKRDICMSRNFQALFMCELIAICEMTQLQKFASFAHNPLTE